MNDPRLLGTELDLTALGGAHRLADIRCNRAEARVGHQPPRTQDLAEAPDQRHQVRGGDRPIEIDLAGLDLLCEILCALLTDVEHGARIIGCRVVRLSGATT